MNKDTQMLSEAYGTIYRGPKTEQGSKDYGMNIAPYMHIIKQLSQGAFDTDSEQDMVSKGELQGIFDVDTVDGHRQVVLTNDAIAVIDAKHPELKDKFWDCGKCKADYAGCSAAKHSHEQQEVMSIAGEENAEGKLKYNYEVATAYLPRDIDTTTKQGEDRVLQLAYDEVVKRIYQHHKNPAKAASNLFMYDEDFPMEVVSQYNHYQKHGFPDMKEKDAEQFKQQMPDSTEEYSAQDYVKDMEMRGEAEEEPKHPLGNVRAVPARDLKPGDVLSLFKNTVIKTDDMAPRLVKGKVRVTYKDTRGVVHNVDWNKGTKISVDNVSQEDAEEGDLMKHMKDKGMIDAKATDDTGKYGRTREEEEGTKYVVGKTYTITLHNGEKFTGVFKYQRDMDRYDRSTGAYGSSWEQVLSNGTHVVVVGHGRPNHVPGHVPGEDEQRRLDPKCWKGYHKSGTKMKSGVRVNNCVKN
jgi:hypothetical protein